MSKDQFVGAPSEMAKPIKTDVRDQRVKELTTCKTKQQRLSLFIDWVRTGKIDLKTSMDLAKIGMREAEMNEVAKDLRELVKKYGKRHSDERVNVKNFGELIAKLPSITSKMEVIAGAETR